MSACPRSGNRLHRLAAFSAASTYSSMMASGSPKARSLPPSSHRPFVATSRTNCTGKTIEESAKEAEATGPIHVSLFAMGAREVADLMLGTSERSPSIARKDTRSAWHGCQPVGDPHSGNVPPLARRPGVGPAVSARSDRREATMKDRGQYRRQGRSSEPSLSPWMPTAQPPYSSSHTVPSAAARAS